jgi:hypothetical protein
VFPLAGVFSGCRGHGIGMPEEWSECAMECSLRLMESRGERTIALYGAPGLDGDNGMEVVSRAWCVKICVRVSESEGLSMENGVLAYPGG